MTVSPANNTYELLLLVQFVSPRRGAVPRDGKDGRRPVLRHDFRIEGSGYHCKHVRRIALARARGGFAGRVARTACSLCKGWCCTNGEYNAFLDEGTMARVRCAKSALDVRAVLRLFVERVTGGRVRGFVHISRKTRLHAGPVAAVRCVQRLLLWWTPRLLDR
jgi:hypothetical protein